MCRKSFQLSLKSLSTYELHAHVDIMHEYVTNSFPILQPATKFLAFQSLSTLYLLTTFNSFLPYSPLSNPTPFIFPISIPTTFYPFIKPIKPIIPTIPIPPHHVPFIPIFQHPLYSFLSLYSFPCKCSTTQNPYFHSHANTPPLISPFFILVTHNLSLTISPPSSNTHQSISPTTQFTKDTHIFHTQQAHFPHNLPLPILSFISHILMPPSHTSTFSSSISSLLMVNLSRLKRFKTRRLRIIQMVPRCRHVYFHAVYNLKDAHEQISTTILTALKESKPVHVGVSCNLLIDLHVLFSLPLTQNVNTLIILVMGKGGVRKSSIINSIKGTLKKM